MYTNALFSTLRFLNSNETSHNNNNTKVSMMLWFAASAVVLSVQFAGDNQISPLFLFFLGLSFFLTKCFTPSSQSNRHCACVLALATAYVSIVGYSIIEYHVFFDISINLALIKVSVDRISFIHLVTKKVLEKSKPGYQMELSF